MIHADTETFLISPGCLAPPMVCYQWRDDEGTHLIHARDPALPRIVEEHLRIGIDGHNFAYDMAVLCAWRKDLIPLIFDAYASDRVTCTKVRETLIHIAKGDLERIEKYGGGLSLAACLKRWTGFEIDKTDPWRLRYGTLIDVPVTQWPEGATHYALLDADSQGDLFWAQETADGSAGDNPGCLQDQFRQSRAAFWLHLMTCWGIRTDTEACEALERLTQEEIDRDAAALVESKLLRLDGTKDTKAAKKRMVEVCESKGLEVAKTAPSKTAPDGNVSLDEDACLASGDPVLEAYSRFASSGSTMTRVRRLRYGNTIPLQATFDPIKETGRTSCRQGDVKPGAALTTVGTQLQNLPRKEGLRECFVPREGYVFAAADYSGMELCTWAQVCLWALGQSRMAEVLNAGGDPHTELGASIHGIAKAEAYRLKSIGDDAFDLSRQSAKIADFGYPGGMGPPKLALQARKQYRVEMTIDQARELRRLWGDEWPESDEYFRWINRLVSGGTGTISHFRSNRIRGGVRYTQAANSFFQGLAADAAKHAGWRIATECYVGGGDGALFGSRPVVFNHDEFVLEVPENRAHDAALRLAEVMVSSAQEWVPDVKIKAEPVLMRRWSKKAKPVWVEGVLTPWG